MSILTPYADVVTLAFGGNPALADELPNLSPLQTAFAKLQELRHKADSVLARRFGPLQKASSGR